MSNHREELILGIDPGSLRTGFGLVRCKGGRVFHVAHGTIVLDRRRSAAERLKDLAFDLTTLIDQYQPGRACVEDVFFYKNARSALILGQARGAALAVLGLRRIPVKTMAPTVVKSMVAGGGHALKFQVAQLVAIELSIEIPKSQDASDALALAVACAHLHEKEQ